jgi:hypothetical protein
MEDTGSGRECSIQSGNSAIRDWDISPGSEEETTKFTKNTNLEDGFLP